jgi:hypothetical protein
MLGLPYSPENMALVATQAACVGLTGAGGFALTRRLRGGAWALVLPLSLGGVVAGLALAPDAADALTWLAFAAVPLLAAAARGWAMRGARPAFALAAVPLLALAWFADSDVARLALVAGANITLGRLLVAVAPLELVRYGVVAMAALDAVLVFSNGIDQPNATLNAAIPAEGLPQLQYAALGGASLGFGDFFVAGVAGAVVAADGLPAARTALLTLACSLVFGLLFWVTDTLPATVPVAIALMLATARSSSRRSRSRTPAA